MLTGALIGPVLAPDQGETPLLRLFWLPVYAIVAGLVLLRFKTIARAWPAVLAWACIVSLAFASKYWSIDPSMTGRRVIAMIISGSFAMYLGTTFHGHCLPRLLTHCAFIMGLLSILMVFAVPSIGVHQDVNAGMWRGIWYEKNQMGMVMAAGGTAAAAWAASEDRRWKTPLLTILLCFLLVLAARSKTSLLCIMLGVGMVGALWTLKRGGPALAVAAVWMGVVGGAAGWWLWTYESAEILAALGKDPSLTGRTGIWDALFVKIAERPWTGYGYNAFWGLDSEPALWVRYQTGWVVPSAHNGWIDVLVQLGWPGAILVGTLTALTVLITLVRVGGAGGREGYWALGYFTAFFRLSLSESILLSHQNLPWVLFLAMLTRAVTPDPSPVRATLAPRPTGAYLTGSRIAAQYAHGPVRRPFPVR